MEADSSTVIIGADGAQDINDLGEDDSLFSDLMALAISGLSVLDKNVPGLNGVLSEVLSGAF